ncbi:lipase family protein [Streptomyces sp. NPDC014894]|uniref:lipase family protein n=1 Tax=Streptomyces sp. NPDC014894 TaxID=3364931 RepID=UPI0036FDD7CD
MSTPSAIDHRATEHSPHHAYWMARASDLAHQDEATVEREAAAWRFGAVRHHRSRLTPPFPPADTQAYTLASEHMIVTAFRGTEPARIRDRLSDASTPPWPGPARTGYVHHGFGRALDSVFPSVRQALAELRDNEQTVWFTGHSLGGALAMLAGCRTLLEEPGLRADGIHTFGQPRTCDRILAAACDKEFKDRLHRYVNNNDIVPRLPPEPVYTHAATLRYIDSAGRLRGSMPRLEALSDRVKGLTADLFAPASDGVRDHLMGRYITALERNLG